MEQEAKKGIFGVLTAALMSIMVALIVGGSTWYVMDQKVKRADETVGGLNQRVLELEKKSSEDLQVTPIKESSAEHSQKTGSDEAEAFCLSNVDMPGTIVTSLIYTRSIKGTGEEFVGCGIGIKNSSGFYLIGKKISGKWTKIYEGQQTISSDLAKKYNVPNAISGLPTD